MTDYSTYCSPQRHLANSHSDESSSNCRNVNNKLINKDCNFMNLYTLYSSIFCSVRPRLHR